MFVVLMWGYLIVLVCFTVNVKKCRHGDTEMSCRSKSVKGSQK